jgi:hypothetical protein
VALATGCAAKIDPSSMPAPFSQGPVPSASTGQPAYVCTAVYQILTSGAARLSNYAGGHTEADRTGLRTTLGEMASKVSAQGTETTDAQLKTAIDGVAADLRAGSQQPDPSSYLSGDFTTVGQKLDGHCA